MLFKSQNKLKNTYLVLEISPFLVKLKFRRFFLFVMTSSGNYINFGNSSSTFLLIIQRTISLQNLVFVSPSFLEIRPVSEKVQRLYLYNVGKNRHFENGVYLTFPKGILWGFFSGHSTWWIEALYQISAWHDFFMGQTH